MAETVPDWAKAPTAEAVPDWAKASAPKPQETKPEAPEPKGYISGLFDAITGKGDYAPNAEDKAIDSKMGPLSGIMKAIVGTGEAALNAGTGMVAKPVSDVAGLAAAGSDMLRGNKNGDPQGFKREVQDRMTYEPKTSAGKAISQYNPMAMLGKGVDAVGGGVQQLIAPPESGPVRQAIGSGVHEAINQVPQLLGAKGPAIADAAGAGLKDAARGTMQSALKPTEGALRTGKAGKAIDTMLDEGLNVSPGGVEKMQGRIRQLNDQITNAIQNSPARVNTNKILSGFQTEKKRFEKQVNSTDDLAALQKAHDDFITSMDRINPGRTTMPVQMAQEVKQGTYQRLGDKSYGELKSADIQGQKELARLMKEEIARAVPEVAPLNSKESSYLNALSVSERRVMMEANKNPAGLGWLTTDPVRFAAWMADRSGLFKSLVARMLNSASKAAPQVGKLAPLGGAATTQAANALPPPPSGEPNQGP